MISTKYLWHRFRNKNQKFNLLKELFLSERAPIITTIFISAIIGVLALAGAYFQRYLFAQLIDPTFSTSGWVYFGLISALAILRFFLFNVDFPNIVSGSKVWQIKSQSIFDVTCKMPWWELSSMCLNTWAKVSFSTISSSQPKFSETLSSWYHIL